MKRLILLTILILSQNVLFSQIIAYKSYENPEIKKETYLWSEKTTTITEIKNGNKIDYPLSKVEIDENNRKKVTIYDKSGKIKEVNVGFMESTFLEIYEMQSGDKEIKKYDANENLISEIWLYPDGSKDEKRFTYRDNKLVEILEKDEFGTSTEKLKYVDDKLSQIVNFDEDGDLVMERKIVYDNEGRIKQTLRIQNGEINKKTHYHYDDNNRLVKKEEEKINRLSSENMPPEIYEYTYHNSGQLKEEKWIVFKGEGMAEKTYAYISAFNQLGLEIKTVEKNYVKNSEEITTYSYTMK